MRFNIIILVPVRYWHLKRLKWKIFQCKQCHSIYISKMMAESHFNLLFSTKHLARGLPPLGASRGSLIGAVNEKLLITNTSVFPLQWGSVWVARILQDCSFRVFHTPSSVKSLVGIIVPRGCKCWSHDWELLDLNLNHGTFTSSLSPSLISPYDSIPEGVN